MPNIIPTPNPKATVCSDYVVAAMDALANINSSGPPRFKLFGVPNCGTVNLIEESGNVAPDFAMYNKSNEVTAYTLDGMDVLRLEGKTTDIIDQFIGRSLNRIRVVTEDPTIRSTTLPLKDLNYLSDPAGLVTGFPQAYAKFNFFPTTDTKPESIYVPPNYKVHFYEANTPDFKPNEASRITVTPQQSAIINNNTCLSPLATSKAGNVEHIDTQLGLPVRDLFYRYSISGLSVVIHAAASYPGGRPAMCSIASAPNNYLRLNAHFVVFEQVKAWTAVRVRHCMGQLSYNLDDIGERSLADIWKPQSDRCDDFMWSYCSGQLDMENSDPVCDCFKQQNELDKKVSKGTISVGCVSIGDDPSKACINLQNAYKTQLILKSACSQSICNQLLDPDNFKGSTQVICNNDKSTVSGKADLKLDGSKTKQEVVTVYPDIVWVMIGIAGFFVVLFIIRLIFRNPTSLGNQVYESSGIPTTAPSPEIIESIVG